MGSLADSTFAGPQAFVCIIVSTGPWTLTGLSKSTGPWSYTGLSKSTACQADSPFPKHGDGAIGSTGLAVSTGLFNIPPDWQIRWAYSIHY
ncbi:hypothetical protein NG798_24180 [Ancylothrix sp. C2]|uniref:hypothetical protein n=1 Tax=Ancylothrix sp. D3o TaxID=2953691 RepID=UPI0021BB59B4|nr:hypothetical protein [Ancylothrix sp. D3o]MCT7952902.1 hypothetical protein [Ancylothrix sp. D3o]